MTKYSCPYCFATYYSKDKHFNSLEKCVNCGEPIIKVYSLNFRKVLAIVSVFSFILPLSLGAVSIFMDLYSPRLEKNISPSQKLY